MVNLTAALRILTEGSYQKGAGNDINLRKSSVSDDFLEYIEAMYEGCLLYFGIREQFEFAVV